MIVAQREFVHMIQSINWAQLVPSENSNSGCDVNQCLGMNDIMKKLEDTFGVGSEKRYYRKVRTRQHN